MNSKRPTRLQRELKEHATLGKTSPVVPWNGETIRQAKAVKGRLAAAKADNARFADSLPRLAEELEEAWRAK